MAKKASKSKAAKKTTKKVTKKAKKSPVRRSPVPRETKAKKTVVRNSAIPKTRSKNAAPSAAIATVAAPAQVTFEMIATRAYFIAQSGYGGSEADNWLRAEWELHNGKV